MLHLVTKHAQLSLQVLPSGHVALVYLGSRIGETDLSYVVTDIKRASYLADTDSIKDFKLEQISQLYPAYGNPDLRTPAHKEVYSDGSRISDFRYSHHEFLTVKPQLDGLPYASGDQTQTLRLVLQDTVTDCELAITITAFYDHDVFTQSVQFTNGTKEELTIQSLQSLNLDLLTDQYDLITLTGAWGREMGISRRGLYQGIQGVDSKRGASGHGQNPFIALADAETMENQGSVIACSLLYSGNFSALAEVDMHQNTRLQLGINPFEFDWTLAAGEAFQTPEACFLYTDQGLNAMSQTFHRFFQDCVVRSRYADKERPVLLNNWEATYFDFDAQKLTALADEAAAVGVELFVLDDGWFGDRKDDTTSLGDWQPNEEKLGGTLNELVQRITAKGLRFGLWLEPEMVSPASDLYHAHPDWAVQVAGRTPQQVRHQYVLDLCNPAVQEYLIATLTELLTTADIRYVKWDMNRNLTDCYSPTLAPKRQSEFAHRYILGLYRILAAVTTRFPDVLFEGCAGGGGRFDAGMLYYMPQSWASDDTDAIERLKIQAGTALVYPPVAMGCHISAVPNHQVGRITEIATRAVVAQQGNFGYELNLLALSEEEKLVIKEQIATYKKRRRTLQFGLHYRLRVYDKENEFAWMKVSKDGTQAIISHVTLLAKPNTVPKRLKLLGLQPELFYRMGDTVRSGKEWQQIGISLPKPTHDFFAAQWELTQTEQPPVLL